MMSNKNDWHERGELPPVGEICNYKTSSGKSAKVEITAHSRMGICFCEVDRDGESYVSKGQILNFAPIRTERDVLVEKAKSDFIQAKVGGHTVYEQRCIEALIDAGWRPIKQQAEDEFRDQAWDECGAFKEAAELLYRAGCRFVDMENKT